MASARDPAPRRRRRRRDPLRWLRHPAGKAGMGELPGDLAEAIRRLTDWLVLLCIPYRVPEEKRAIAAFQAVRRWARQHPDEAGLLRVTPPKRGRRPPDLDEAAAVAFLRDGFDLSDTQIVETLGVGVAKPHDWVRRRLALGRQQLTDLAAAPSDWGRLATIVSRLPTHLPPPRHRGRPRRSPRS